MLKMSKGMICSIFLKQSFWNNFFSRLLCGYWCKKMSLFSLRDNIVAISTSWFEEFYCCCFFLNKQTSKKKIILKKNWNFVSILSFLTKAQQRPASYAEMWRAVFGEADEHLLLQLHALLMDSKWLKWAMCGTTTYKWWGQETGHWFFWP